MNGLGIDEMIAKQQQQMLRSLEQQFLKRKSPEPKQITPLNSAELHICQLKTVSKRIEHYKQQLHKINKLNTNSVMLEIKGIKEEINKKQGELTQLKRQLTELADDVGQMRKISVGKEKNKEILLNYEDKNYQIQLLRKKLQRLEHSESNICATPSKRNARSFSQTIKVPDTGAKPEKKTKVDEFALFKNLLKFYTQEESKLKLEIEDLQKQRAAKQGQNNSLRQQVATFQEKLEVLKKKKVQPQGKVHQSSTITVLNSEVFPGNNS